GWTVASKPQSKTDCFLAVAEPKSQRLCQLRQQECHKADPGQTICSWLCWCCHNSSLYS
ncbi:unnamed protein product, partial [Candidula unifasciata]